MASFTSCPLRLLVPGLIGLCPSPCRRTQQLVHSFRSRRCYLPAALTPRNVWSIPCLKLPLHLSLAIHLNSLRLPALINYPPPRLQFLLAALVHSLCGLRMQ
ncbi:hypothetical protein BDQ12DRAFT_692338 [Crucibulum laeve]|uniref:Uncharacterized protein n=1 Tax=Crucibulum laeve TaxID=68775 RepID=A0A5C3LIA6_9AGAR|nr:hypothetical protein BDQ12DRAFT_692338 [Crucibulum laeve]